MSIKTIFKFWLPPALWASVIFFFSSVPTMKTSEIYWQDFIVKKIAHITEYGILATLLYRALKESAVSKKKSGILAIIIVFFYGLTDEFHQNFTPGREPRIRDVLIDTAGATFSVLLLWKWEIFKFDKT